MSVTVTAECLLVLNAATFRRWFTRFTASCRASPVLPSLGASA